MKRSLYQEVKTKENLAWLNSDSATEIIAVTYIGTSYRFNQYYQSTDEFIRYMDWSEKFDLDVNALWESQPEVTDVSMNHARRLGVERRWQWEEFFTQDHVNAPEEIFQYIGAEGENLLFTAEEIAAIEMGERIKGIEGHHINDVSSNIEDVVLASDPNNIEFATNEGHLWLHGGNWSNPTTGETNEILTRIDMTKEYNRGELLVNESLYTRYMPILLTSAAYMGVYGTVRYLHLKNMPISLEDRIKFMMTDTVEEGGKTLGVLMGATIASTWLEASMDTVFISYNNIFGSFTNAGAFSNMFSMNSSFLFATTINTTYQAIKGYNNGMSTNQIAEKLGDDLANSTKEFLAFNGIALVLDLFIPDPTGIFLAGRIGYGVYKLFSQGIKYFDYRSKHKIYQKVIGIQIDNLYANAIEDIRNKEKGLVLALN